MIKTNVKERLIEVLKPILYKKFRNVTTELKNEWLDISVQAILTELPKMLPGKKKDEVDTYWHDTVWNRGWNAYKDKADEVFKTTIQ